MYRTFIAIIAGLAIAITALGVSARPAAADNEDVARALAAIVGIAIIGKAIHNARKDDHVVHQPKTYQPRPHTNVHRDRVYKEKVHRHPVQPRPLPPRAGGHHKLLPQACFRSFQTYSGPVRGFPARCLNRNYRHSATLPGACAIRIDTHRGRTTAYEARCLRDRGYRLARG